MSQIVNIWQIYCISEGKFVSGPLMNGVTCTTCFNDTSHTVNPNSVSMLYTINPTTTLISTQNPGETAGNYKCKRKLISVPSGTTGQITVQTTTFPYSVGILSFDVDVSADNIGDMFEVCLLPIPYGGIVGVLMSNVTAGDTVIPIPSTSMGYFTIGRLLAFINSSTYAREEETEIISIDTVNNTVTLASGITSSWTAGNYISFTIRKIESYYMNATGNRGVGDFLRSALLPVTVKTEVRYTNNNTSAKTFVYGVNMLY